MLLRPLFTSLLCCAFAFLISCKKDKPVSSNGLTPVTFVTDWYPQPEHGGFYNALVRGYYKEGGLDVTILPGGTGGAVNQRIAIGSAQFGMSTSDDISISVEQGLPLITIGPTMQHDPKGIMVHPESGITDFSQLEGKTISAGPTAAWFRYVASKYKWKNVLTSPLTFSVANFVTNPTYIQEIFVTSEPFFVEKAGIKYRVLLTRDTGFDPYRVFFTNKKFISENPKLVQAFVTASIRGWKDYMIDPSAANAEIQKLNPDMNPEKMDYSWKALRDGKYISGDTPEEFGKLDPARMKKQYDILRSIGVLNKDLGAEASYTTQFLEK